MKKITSWLVICAMLMTMLSGMVMVTAAEVGDNVMTNSSFDISEDGSLNGWYNVGNDFIYAEEVEEGNGALVLDGTVDYTQWTTAVSYDMALDSNSTYTISWDAKVEGGNYAKLYVYDVSIGESDAGVVAGINGWDMATEEDTDWTTKTAEITTVGSLTVKIGIKTNGNVGKSAKTYIDNMTVVKTSVNEIDYSSPYADEVITWESDKINATLVSSAHFGNADRLVDGSIEKGASSDGTKTWTDYTFVVDLGDFYILEGYNLYGGNKTAYDDPYDKNDFGEYDDGDHVYHRMPRAWNLYYSLDGNSWSPLTTVERCVRSLYQTDLSELNVTAKYIKYEQTANFNYCEWGSIREFEVYGTQTTIDVPEYTVTFMLNGEVYSTASVMENFTVAAPKEPGILDYEFAGWYTEDTFENLYDFSTPVTEAITLYAKMDSTAWANPKIPLTWVSGSRFDSGMIDGNIVDNACNSGSWTWSDYNMVVDLGGVYELEGYNLYGGYYAADAVDPYDGNDYGSLNDNFYRRMSSAWDLYYSYDNVSWLPLTSVTGNTLSLVKGDLNGATARYIKLQLTGAFAWGAEWGCVREFEVFGKETTVELAEYTVDFFTMNGEIYKSVTVKEGFPVEEPERPYIDGYTFVGWYTDDTLTTPWDFSQAITDNTKIYAKFNEALVVDENRKIDVDPDNVTSNGETFDSLGDRMWKAQYWFSGGSTVNGHGGDLWCEYNNWNEIYADLGGYYSIEAIATDAKTNTPFSIYASNDMTEWVSLSGDIYPEFNEYTTIESLDQATSYRYVKIVMLGGKTWTEWAGVSLYGVMTAPVEDIPDFNVYAADYADGALTATFYNTTEEAASAIVMTAVYDGNELLEVITQDLSVEPGVKAQSFSQKIDAATGNTVKAFVLTSKSAAQPMMENIDITVK